MPRKTNQTAVAFKKKMNTTLYNMRLNEIGLQGSNYTIWAYEEAAGNKLARYYICQNHIGHCTCGEKYEDVDIRRSRETALTHFRRVFRNGESRIEPVILVLLRNEWICHKCYTPDKGYVTLWDDNSDLVAPKESITKACKKCIATQALVMEQESLAQIFQISTDTVSRLLRAEIKRRDNARHWDNIRTLGLYTVALGPQQKEYCLCTDAENENFIEWFQWADALSAQKFGKQVAKEHTIQKVITSIDEKACDYAQKYFPQADHQIDRIDVKSRLLSAMQSVRRDEVQGWPTETRYKYQAFWQLFDKESPEDLDGNDKWKINKIGQEFPLLGAAYSLKEKGYEIYRQKSQQGRLVDEWISADKFTFQPFKKLEKRITVERNPVVKFAEQYCNINRNLYEESLNRLKYPLYNFLSLNESAENVSAVGSRAVSDVVLRGKILYGAAELYNNGISLYGEATDNNPQEMSFGKSYYMIGLWDERNWIESSNQPPAQNQREHISSHNFGIPLTALPDLIGTMIEFRGVLLDLNQQPSLETESVENPHAEYPEDERKETPYMSNSFDRILAQLRSASTSKSNQGTMMERLIKQFLLVSPLYSRVYDKVWLWTEFPYNGNQHDLGIDLVAHIRGENEGYCAVQVKFYDENHAVQKADVDTFLSASGKPFYVGGVPVYFQQRLIVSTTDKWSSTAENTIIGQRPPVNRIRLKDLQDSGIDWDSFTLDSIESMKQAPKKQPRPHQREAIKSVLSGFEEHDRGKLIMACGTGKTLTGLKIAEGLTQGKGNVLILVPSISLLNQTLSEWAAQCAYPYTVYGICSDPKASKITEDEIVDTMVPATTNVDTLCRQFAECDSSTLQLFFSTYQSINVIHDFQQQTGVPFDLVICDEAHRTTGVTLAGEDDSNFVRVHDNQYIIASKRLYMTATPRIYADGSKQKAKDNSALLCSMDDETIYGPEFYRLSFSDAVSQGLLSDYKVIVLAVDEDFVSRSLQRQLTDANNELTLDDAVKIVGCMNGLAKKNHFPGEEDYFANDPQPMHRAVAFTQTIDQSKKFVAMFEEIQALYKINTSDGDSQTVELKHVDGTTNALERKNRIEWLKQDAGENTCRVLSNARCLSEGVDVPALDAVMFLNPRKSIVDIIQSVGRVMRKSEGKKYGYIILPIGIPAGVEPEKALADNEKYRIVWDVLQALRAHDDRFNNTINRIELNKHKPDNISIIGVTGFDDNNGTNSGNGNNTAYDGSQLSFDMTELSQWKDNIYAKIVKKCGSRQYWETWAKDIADIAARHIAEIRVLIEQPDIAPKFDAFLVGLRSSLNPSIDKDDAIEMLAEHLITKPVFDALFDNYSFLQSNPVSRIMQNMLDVLHNNSLEKEQETLDKFYASVQERAKGIDNAEGKQKIIIELYEQFFKNALPKETERLGIVYTPVEVVDFIIQSVEYVMRQRFGHSISDMGVHILDPFTGTGTFIVRLLRSGIIKPEDLLYKYTSEIHCNEIVLLAYYIAAVNIEETYHELSQSENYVPFEGIVLTDTFELAERVGTREGEADTSVFQPNADRATKQMQTPIQVIIGNPPYSVGQKNGNDNNQNVSYPHLEEAVANTYAANSKAALKRNTYESSIMAIRWATDRIGDNGIVAFVTNGSFIKSGSHDGFRKCLLEEYNSVYCFDLRGDQRTQGEASRKEGGKIFGSGSRARIAIIVLVRKKGVKKDGFVRYCDIGDYLSRSEKLQIIEQFGSVEKVPWNYITPDENNDWLNHRNPAFANLIALGDKKKREKLSIYADNYAMGLSTNRDVWIYDYNPDSHKTREMIDFYNAEIDRCSAELQAISESNKISITEKARPTILMNIRSDDPHRISWSRGLYNLFCKQEKIDNTTQKLVTMRRPYCKQYCYYQRKIIECPSKWESLFPDGNENVVMCVSGAPLSKPFCTIITDCIQDLNLLQHSQCFPLYIYEKEENKESAQLSFENMTEGESVKWHKRSAITDATLSKFKEIYGERISKEDIFYYMYAVFQSKGYIAEYADNLSKEMPRIPMLANFPEYVRIGRALADLHLHYEKPVTAEEVGVTVDMRTEDYTIVDKMRFGKNKDKSIIEYNPYITIRNIPATAYDYIVNGKSAIEWIVEQYAVTTDKASGIVNDPNTYAGGKYVFDLLLSIISVSLKTQELIAQLPEYKEI